MKKGRLLFLATALAPPGGGMSVGAWMLQALKDEWEITIYSWQRPDLVALNRHFGTRLQESDFKIETASGLMQWILKLDPDPYSFLRTAFLMRKCRKNRDRFDVFVSAENEIDYGTPGVQYIHHPYLAKWREPAARLERSGFWKRILALISGRWRPWMWISGLTFSGVESNLTMVNSAWTRELVARHYDAEIMTVFPPAAWTRPVVAWEERRNTFISIGRIESVKRQIMAIDILSEVRARGYEVGLEIVGDISCPEYAEELNKRARAAGSWVNCHHSLTRAELEELVGSCRYGLHTMAEEHYGIAIAEMVLGGLVVFVPRGGGQIEILDDAPDQVYADAEDAVRKIIAMLDQPKKQASALQLMTSRRDALTTETFEKRVRSEIGEFSARRAQQ